MLSRRSVRVKAMQLMYALDRDASLTAKDIYKAYSHNISMSFELFVFTIYIFINITKSAVNDAEKRKLKHLPTDYDKRFTDKLFTNPLIQNIAENKVLDKHFDKLEFESKVNSDYIQKIYDEFSKSEAHKTFIANDSTNVEYLEILLELYRFCRQNEYFNEILEDAYHNWMDDKSLVVGTFKKFLKILPAQSDTAYKEFFPEDETVKEFGLNLLKTTISKKKQIDAVIIPSLENWDHDRLALVDTILLQLSLSEMLHFPTIPCKVTLNEYVEIAKNYSTAKSKEFINGILDKLMKDLIEKGEIQKEGRGLVD